jgi:hypothetical protein
MKTKEEILSREICECGSKSVLEAIEIFQCNSSLPFKKSKKLVTECNKNCCRIALRKLADMCEYGVFDYDEIDHLIELRLERIAKLLEESDAR